MPAIVVSAEATAATVPVQILRPRTGRPAERHAERVVEREQHARAEALDLERAPELAPDAPHHALGREDREGKVDEQRRADASRAERRSAAGAALAPPRSRDEQRQSTAG